jgi:hypothetical protein
MNDTDFIFSNNSDTECFSENLFNNISKIMIITIVIKMILKIISLIIIQILYF